MLTATVRDTRSGPTLRPAAASTLAPSWLSGTPGPVRVAAVFDLAVYLLRGHDVLPLLAPEALALPGGLRVAGRTDLDVLALTVGDEVSVGHGQVLARAAGLVVRRTWRPVRVPSAVLPPPALALARSALAARPPVADDLGPELARLARLTAADPVDGPAAELVGLGPGLTPAGDDVLCGLLLGLRATGRDRDRCALERTVTPLLGRTTALSATLLQQAAAGYAVPPVVRLLQAWHGGAGPQLAGLGAEVAAVGHTSGPALLLGLAATLAPPRSPLPTPAPDVARRPDPREERRD